MAPYTTPTFKNVVIDNSESFEANQAVPKSYVDSRTSAEPTFTTLTLGSNWKIVTTQNSFDIKFSHGDDNWETVLPFAIDTYIMLPEGYINEFSLDPETGTWSMEKEISFDADTSRFFYKIGLDMYPIVDDSNEVILYEGGDDNVDIVNIINSQASGFSYYNNNIYSGVIQNLTILNRAPLDLTDIFGDDNEIKIYSFEYSVPVAGQFRSFLHYDSVADSYFLVLNENNTVFQEEVVSGSGLGNVSSVIDKYRSLNPFTIENDQVVNAYNTIQSAGDPTFQYYTYQNGNGDTVYGILYKYDDDVYHKMIEIENDGTTSFVELTETPTADNVTVGLIGDKYSLYTFITDGQTIETVSAPLYRTFGQANNTNIYYSSTDGLTYFYYYYDGTGNFHQIISSNLAAFMTSPNRLQSYQLEESIPKQYITANYNTPPGVILNPVN